MEEGEEGTASLPLPASLPTRGPRRARHAPTAERRPSPPSPTRPHTCVPADEPLPLILVGQGRTLRLRNLRLVNAASLAACLQLAPGAASQGGAGCRMRFLTCPAAVSAD